MLRNFMLQMAYDGTDFHGWQFQPGMRTVQGTLEQALRRTLRHRVSVIGCSRTDAGVHAAGYVANFFSTQPDLHSRMAQRIGSRLPKDMTLTHLEEVPLTFHATASAIQKLYRYRIYNTPARPCERFLQRQVYHCWQSLDIEKMRQAAAFWIGQHDFSSFASAGNDRSSNVRIIDLIEMYRVGREVRIDVIGRGFLYKQVRNMVGTLYEIGRGKMETDQARDILLAKDRSQAGPTAPARGLCLQWVRYDLPHLPEPTADMLERAQEARPPTGQMRDHVDDRPISTAPMPPGIEMTEEPSG